MTHTFDAARLLHEQGRLSEAAAAYRSIPAQDPDCYRALNNLGLILEGEGRLSKAAATLDEAVAAKGDSAVLHCNRARVLHRLGRLAEAVAGYGRSIELDPTWVDPQHNLAIAFEELGKLGDAEIWYGRTLNLEPDNIAAHRRLGEILFDAGRVSEALTHYRQVLIIDPNAARAHFDLAKALTALGCHEDALDAYRRCLDIEPRSGPAYQNLVDLLRRQHRLSEAADVLNAWIARAPEDPIPRHLLAAVTGEGVPERATDDTVRQVFNELAESFDARLAYRAPQLVLAAIVELYPRADAVYDILDVGCGTGLCGPLLRPRARRLIGVDLSSGMLEEASQRGVYDELVEGELTDYLRRHTGCYDIIAAADTLNYFGALDVVLGAAAGGLRNNGHLVFTLECETTTESSPWRLQPNGRYSHSDVYVRAEVRDAGLDLVSLRRNILRREGMDPVQGWLVSCVRTARDTDRS